MLCWNGDWRNGVTLVHKLHNRSLLAAAAVAAVAGGGPAIVVIVAADIIITTTTANYYTSMFYWSYKLLEFSRFCILLSLAKH